MGATRFRFDG